MREPLVAPTAGRAPNQWSADGPLERVGERRDDLPAAPYGAISGAKIARTRKIPTRMKPTIAPGLRRSRLKASLQRPCGAWLENLAAFELGDRHQLMPDSRVDERRT